MHLTAISNIPTLLLLFIIQTATAAPVDGTSIIEASQLAPCSYSLSPDAAPTTNSTTPAGIRVAHDECCAIVAMSTSPPFDLHTKCVRDSSHELPHADVSA